MVQHSTVLFEDRRPFLTGLAYRILGSLAEAEDAVQDTYLKWQGLDHDTIANAAAWLTTACTRRCIDMLRSAHKGVADRLMQCALEKAASDGAPEIYHTIFDHNEREKRFYVRFGFREVGRRTFRLGARVDDDRIWRLCLL